MAKFKDPETGEVVKELTEYTYSYKFEFYKDKFDNPLLNKSGKPLEIVKTEKDWSDPDSIPSYAAFGSKSDKEKGEILKKRSKDRTIQQNKIGGQKKDWIDNVGGEKPKKKKTISVSGTKKK